MTAEHYVSNQEIRIKTTEVDDFGVPWHNCYVDDISELERGENKERLLDEISELNAQLRDNPDWEAPNVSFSKGIFELRNPASEKIYENPGMREWREKLVPTAMALFSLQYPNSARLPSRDNPDATTMDEWLSGGKIDSKTRDYFVNATDAVGIRTRSKLFQNIAERYAGGEDGAKWVSLACGAAVPVLEAISATNLTNSSVELELIDRDETALNFARTLAAERGVTPNPHEPVDLVQQMILSDQLVQTIGEESALMVDALGIYEYIPDEATGLFLQNSYRMVKPGGVLAIGNMRDTHPELPFNERGIGWPKIFPRSDEDIIGLVAQAGIPLENVSAYTSQDGIYAVLEIKK